MAPTSQHRKPMFLQVLLGAFVLLTCVRVWTGSQPILPRATAQIPDSGAQRKLLIDEVRRSNELLSQIKQLLEKGTLNVRLRGADNP